MSLMSFLKGHSYFVTMIIIFVAIAVLSHYFNVDRIFYLLYQINYSDINSSMLTVFGVLFAFIFTILAVLFSLNENSFFFKLIQQNNRNKKDVLNYFIVSIISISIVFLISLFLTITYIGNKVIDNNELNLVISIINNLDTKLVYALFYFAEFSFINIILLVLTFILILRH